MTKPERDVTVAVSRAPLFRTLARATAARLAAGASLLNLPRGNPLYQCGKRCPGLYLVLSGRIMLSVGTPTASKVIDLIGPGGYAGLATALIGVPEVTAAETLMDSTLLLIPREILLACAADSAPLALQMAAALARHVHALIVDIEAFALRSGRKRVANFLLQLSVNYGDNQRPLALPAKKSIIASRLGLTPEYFSRMLHELIANGTIAVNGRQITVLDAVCLRQLD